jgi:fused signal recognition particle receptor
MSEEKQGWFARLKQGLSKSSQQIGEGITGIFTKRKLDEATLEELEELLIMADMGAPTAAKIVARIRKDRFEKDIEPQEIREALAQEIALVLEPVAKPLTPDSSHKPHVVLVVGVNGNGKTTTIGKLAKRLQEQGHKVMLGAADTFRAAAVEQLQIWGQRNNVPVFTGLAQADPASVAYQALEQAKAQGVGVLLIDTAGRLQNKQNLMQELQKIVKVIQKLDASAPHSVLQILDATTGQNALSQVKTFKECVNVTGLVVTKLDGTAKAGIVLALADQFGLPIHAIGVGEGIDDLRDFSAADFARNLVTSGV